MVPVLHSDEHGDVGDLDGRDPVPGIREQELLTKTGMSFSTKASS